MKVQPEKWARTSGKQRADEAAATRGFIKDMFLPFQRRAAEAARLQPQIKRLKWVLFVCVCDNAAARASRIRVLLDLAQNGATSMVRELYDSDSRSSSWEYSQV